MKVSGRTIELDGNELAHAIDVYLLAQDVVTAGGPPTMAGKISVFMYVDPDGRVIHDGQLVIDRDRERGEHGAR